MKENLFTDFIHKTPVLHHTESNGTSAIDPEDALAQPRYTTMRTQITITLLGCILMASCVTSPNDTVFDNKKRAPTTAVEIIRDGQKPEKPYTEIGELSQEYFVGEDAVVMKGFVETAKKRGADAIVMLPGRDAAYKFDPFGRSGNRYVWHATTIVWK